MADVGFQKNGTKSVLLVFIFVLSLMGPLFSANLQDGSLDEPKVVQSTGPFSASSGYGHDLGGMAIDVDGLVQASVREESMFDLWSSEILDLSYGEHHGTPDMKLTRVDKTHLCWSTEEGTVRTAVHRPTGVWIDTLVDTVATANASTLVDCAIGVTANELPRVLYADGDDLKMGRYAMSNQNVQGYETPKYHTRTIMEDVSPTHLELDITPQGLEWGLMRTASGSLHQVNFSGAYWTQTLLDAGPVGEQFELSIDDAGVAHVLYSRSSTNDIVLLRVDGLDHDRRVLLQSNNLVDALGMDLDANNIEQVATATQTGTSFSIDLIRSLAGQDSGRVDPVPTDVLDGELDTHEGLMLMADVNHDGFDDLVVSTPTADLVGMKDNGRVNVHYGSSAGLSALPDLILAGENDGAHYGAGMDVGDFNGDGVMDLAIGSPGWAPSANADERHGLIHVFLGNQSGLSPSPWSNLTGSQNESLGSSIAALQQSNGADILAATARNYSFVVSAQKTDQGKVNLYSGNATEMSSLRNVTQTEDGDLFGRSLEGCDVNNDGFDELIVGNTGSYENTLSYSSVEYFFGSAAGYNGSADHTLWQPAHKGRISNRSVEHRNTRRCGTSQSYSPRD